MERKLAKIKLNREDLVALNPEGGRSSETPVDRQWNISWSWWGDCNTCGVETPAPEATVPEGGSYGAPACSAAWCTHC